PVCSGGCANVTYTGNLSPLVNAGQCVSAVTYRHNVWTNGSGGQSGSSDKSVASAGYVNAGARDLHLTAGSAAVDAGSTSVFPGVDIDGQARPMGGAPDPAAADAHSPRPLLASGPGSEARRPARSGLAQHAEPSTRSQCVPHGGLRWTSRRGCRGDPQHAGQAGAPRTSDAHAATVRDGPRGALPLVCQEGACQLPAPTPARPDAVAAQGRRLPSLQLAEELEASRVCAIPLRAAGGRPLRATRAPRL